ncbi:sulfatase-like hydrolase/transferase [Oceaniferula marina]|nr:sulfatase-like hydrolase/transferase [Oceaniferula marina]
MTILPMVLVSAQGDDARKPNLIIIFTDDQGYQDLGCFGSPDIKTPRIDQMAKEGMMLTDFYAQTVCGPSRAALMTGCYPFRNARRDKGEVPHPKLALAEITMAEVLKSAGYATGMVGKWDLAGHSQTKFDMNLRPGKQGFDESFWTPGSNDAFVNLLRDDQLIERKADLSTLTRRYTNEAIQFIDRHKEGPFFLYLAHTMPHTKLAVSTQFKGKSKAGLYGDVIEEIDHHVGRVLDHVKKSGLDENTYVVFTSDNGPWWVKKDHGGHAEPLRGEKCTTYEGGLRVPCVIRAPGNIKPGRQSSQLAATIDLLPTFAALAGAEVPTDRVIDGVDMSAFLHGEAKEKDRSFFFYQHKFLRAVRVGKWKLHVPHTQSHRQGLGKKWRVHMRPENRPFIEEVTLYDLESDVAESKNVASDHPEVVARLMKRIAHMRKDLGDGGYRGENARALGKDDYFGRGIEGK